MPTHAQIQQCIQDCQTQANDLRNLMGQAPNPQVQGILDEAAHHIDICVRECEWVAQRVQQAGRY